MMARALRAAILLIAVGLSTGYSWLYVTNTGALITLESVQTLSLNLVDTATWHPGAIAAIDAWNGVYGAYDYLDYAEEDGGRCDHDDGYNAVEFDNFDNLDCVETLSATALAMTIWTYNDDTMIEETDVLVNTDWDWTTSLSTAEAGYAYYLHGTLLHEFGHVLGLQHEDDVGTVMNTYQSLETATLYSELHADDMAGIRYLYNSGNSSTNVALSAWRAPNGGAAIHIECSTEATTGGELYVEYVVENRGTEAEPAVLSRIYLSDDDEVGGDEEIGFAVVDVDPGEHSVITGTLTVPEYIRGGTWYLMAYVDPDNTISETTSDDNEVFCREPIQITCADIDDDGWSGEACGGDDCDDGDSSIYPGRPEACDGADQDCDGAIDEGVLTAWYADRDGDGWGDGERSIEACGSEAGYIVTRAGDCDDRDDAIHPGAEEVCNDEDDDCDRQVDEGDVCEAAQDTESDVALPNDQRDLGDTGGVVLSAKDARGCGCSGGGAPRPFMGLVAAFAVMVWRRTGSSRSLRTDRVRSLAGGRSMLHFKYVLKGCCPTHLFILLFIMFLVGCVETKTPDGSCVDALDCAPGEECSFGWCQERMRPKSCDEIVLNCTCAFQN